MKFLDTLFQSFFVYELRSYWLLSLYKYKNERGWLSKCALIFVSWEFNQVKRRCTYARLNNACKNYEIVKEDHQRKTDQRRED